MSIIEINTDDITLSKIVQYLQTLKVKYTVKESEEIPYDPEFVEMVQESRKGKSTRLNPENIWENILLDLFKPSHSITPSQITS